MKEVQIGSQIWAKEDLKVTHFQNGDKIPVVQDKDEWSDMTTAAMCFHPDTGGALYNWYAVNDPRGLAPEGWHVPSDEEWTELTDYLGGEDVAGSKMKSMASDTPPWDGSNSSGFSGLPGGRRYYYGNFYDAGSLGYWWSSSPDFSAAWYRLLYSLDDYVNRSGSSRRNGFSVRCVKTI